jgi:CDP-glucose 4,6-dehydratase
MGARVAGYALPPPTTPSFFERTRLAMHLAANTIADIADAAALARALRSFEPQVLFHLAAQPIVRDAYREPVRTFATNVMGTVHALEAARATPSLGQVVVYTTDKVYRNDQSGRPFTEGDALGGTEPYSASKAGAEGVALAYAESYFRARGPALATVRAGNILGGGDWAHDRLIPDAARAFAAGRPLVVRNPASTRPWQHVLDAVRGALLLAEHLDAAPATTDGIAWNFGPAPRDLRSVRDMADLAVRSWGAGALWRHEPDGSIPEATALVLSSERARAGLSWQCAWDAERSVAASIEWYRAALATTEDLWELTRRQVDQHLADVARQAA